jgi:hypothetical protein
VGYTEETPNRDLYSVTAVPGTNLVLAVGSGGTVLRGVIVRHQVLWDEPIELGDQDLHGIAALRDTSLQVAVGKSGTVLNGTIIGDQVQWNKPTRHADRDLNGIASVPGSNMVITVGASDTMLLRTPNGNQVNWDTPWATNTLLRLLGVGRENVNLMGVSASPGGSELFAVGKDGTAEV